MTAEITREGVTMVQLGVWWSSVDDPEAAHALNVEYLARPDDFVYEPDPRLAMFNWVVGNVSGVTVVERPNVIPQPGCCDVRTVDGVTADLIAEAGDGYVPDRPSRERALARLRGLRRKDAVSGATQARDENGRFVGDGGVGTPREYGVDDGYAFHDRNADWAAALPKDQLDSITNFAAFGSEDINRIMRGIPVEVRSYDHPDRLPSLMRDIENITEAIKNGPVTTEPMIVYRAMSLPTREAVESLADTKRMTDRAFQSTNVGQEEKARGYATLDQMYHIALRGKPDAERYPAREGIFARITIPAGTSYVDVEAARRTFNSDPNLRTESELLFGPADYTVNRVQMDAGAYTSSDPKVGTVGYHAVDLTYRPLRSSDSKDALRGKAWQIAPERKDAVSGATQARDEGGRFAGDGGGGAVESDAVGTIGVKARENLSEWVRDNGWTREGMMSAARTLLSESGAATTANGMNWYAEAHAIAETIASDNGITVEAAAGVLAALSPQKNWDENIEIAKSLMEIVAAPTFTLTQNEVKSRWLEAREVARKEDKSAEANNRQYNLAERYRSLQKEKDAASSLVGTRPTSSISAADLAIVAGVPQTRGNTEKAIECARGTSPEKVFGQSDGLMTAGFKVRSFYSNIKDPEKSQQVTIDTHMIRALTNDIGLSDKTAGQMFSSAAKYDLFRGVIKDVAKEAKISPHQAQAIMWIRQRELFDPAARSKVTQALNAVTRKALEPDEGDGETFDGEPFDPWQYLSDLAWHGFDVQRAADMLLIAEAGDGYVPARPSRERALERLRGLRRKDAVSGATQERDESGRFVGDGGGALPNERGPQYARIVSAEGAHRNDATEHTIAANPDGSVLMEKLGSPDSVEFTDSEAALIAATQGVVMTHNHPSGRALSPKDYLFAHEQNLAEIRASRADGGVNRAVLTERAKQMDSATFYKTVRGVDSRVYRVLSDRVMRPEDAKAMHWDIVGHLLVQDGLIHADGLKPMPEWWQQAEAQSLRNRRKVNENFAKTLGTRWRKDAVSGATQARDEGGRFVGDGGGGYDEALTARAVERYGVTDDWRQAGYVLPDGRMLDFSDAKGRGRSQFPFPAQAMRTVDHGDVADLIAPRAGDNPTIGPDNWTSIYRFMEETGAVRLQPESPGISFAGTLTPGQINTVVGMMEGALAQGSERFFTDRWGTQGAGTDHVYHGVIEGKRFVQPEALRRYLRDPDAKVEPISIVSQFHEKAGNGYTRARPSRARALARLRGLARKDAVSGATQERDESGRFVGDGGDSGEVTAATNNNRMDVWFNSVHASGEMGFVALLKQEIAEALGDERGIAGIMPETLPLRFLPKAESNGLINEKLVDDHESMAIMRQQDTAINGKRVDDQVSNLLGESPMTKDEIQTFNSRVFVDGNMNAWHETASDSDARSHALQQAAVDVLGLRDADMGWKDLPGKSAEYTALTGAPEDPGQRRLFDDEAASLAAVHPPEHFNAFIKETYKHTQDELAKLGIKGEVTLYRGMTWDRRSDVPIELLGLLAPRSGTGTKPDIIALPQGVSASEVRFQSNPLTSWSTSIGTAKNFAEAQGRGGRYAVVLKADVQVKDIVSTARTGMGALSETEVIVKGGYIDAVAMKPGDATDREA